MRGRREGRGGRGRGERAKAGWHEKRRNAMQVSRCSAVEALRL